VCDIPISSIIPFLFPNCIHLILLQCVPVFAFNVTSSVHQTPIEGQWRDTNNVTRKWRREFELLTAVQEFSHSDPMALFSLVSVYMRPLSENLDSHYEAMRLRRKEKDTKNPEFPAGTRMRWELFYHDGPSKLIPLSRDEISNIADIGETYWAHREEPSALLDPLTSSVDRAYRAHLITLLMPLSLAEEYAAHRAITASLASRPSGSSIGLANAQDSARSSVQRVRAKIAHVEYLAAMNAPASL
jgi:hypothetical protein